MEDFDAQEVEFRAKLSEEGVSRSQMIRRSAAAAAGLTVLAPAASAFASRARLGAGVPSTGVGLSMTDLVAEAKLERQVRRDFPRGNPLDR